MNAALRSSTWPLERLNEALEAVTHHCRLATRGGELPPPPGPARTLDEESLHRWVVAATECLGAEAEPTEAPYAEVQRLVNGGGPAILMIRGNGAPRFLAVVKSGRGRLTVLNPDLLARPLESHVVRQALCAPFEAPLAPKVESLLGEAGVAGPRLAKARTALLGELLRPIRISGCWLLRGAPGDSFLRQLRAACLPRLLCTLVSAHAVQHGLALLGWWVVGAAVLMGRLESGWLLAWALILATIVPFRLLSIAVQGRISYTAGAILKQRLLTGALRINPQEIRRQGTGQLLARVMESEAVESLAVSGAFLGVMSIIEVVLALLVLRLGAAGGLLPWLFVMWLVLCAGASVAYYRRRRRWTGLRMSLTQDVTERMLGHRTRIAQEAPEHWHDGEDELVQRYLEAGRRMDRDATILLGGLSRAWTIAGLSALTPALFAGTISAGAMAVAVGGILLASRAVARFTGALSFLVDAIIAWEQVAPLFRAAAEVDAVGSAHHALASRPPADTVESPASRERQSKTLIEAVEVSFRFRPAGEPVLRHCSGCIRFGDRVLLEGPSGGGKSTFAAALFGLHQPESGMVLLEGLARRTLGATQWRQRVAAAPQFHENHVLTGSLAFNLLMGRRWPARSDEIAEATEVCRALGLGPLLARMPAGLTQMVGETGWQLSHGEKSRIYIARAILQGADLLILDESFGSLDPETLRLSLEAVLSRTKTLLLIAHP